MKFIKDFKQYFKKIANQWIGWVMIISIVTLSVGMPWPPSEPAHAVDGSMILFWDQTTPTAPTGWTNVTSTYANEYIRGGASTSASAGGNLNHNHTTSFVSMTETTVGGAYPDGAGFFTGFIDAIGHAHIDYTAGVSSAANNPSYQTLQVIQYNTPGVIPSTIPVGVIALFDIDDQFAFTNWTDYTSQNTKLIKVAANSGTSQSSSGSTIHTHATTLTTLMNSIDISSAEYSLGSGATHVNDDHVHGIATNPSLSSENSMPSYYKLNFRKVTTSAADIEVGMIVGWTSHQGIASNANWASVSGSGEKLYQKFIYGDTVNPGSNGGGGTHDHSNYTHTSDGAIGTGTSSSSGFIYSNDHTHDLTFNPALAIEAAYTPIYTDMIFYEYDPPYTPVTRLWQWFDAEDDKNPDDTLGGDTDTGDAMAGEDIQPGSTGNHTRIVYDDNAFKLRLGIGEIDGGVGTAIKFWLQYNDEDVDWSGATTLGATDSCIAQLFCYYNGDNVDDDDVITTNLLTGITYDGRHNEDSDTGVGQGSTFNANAETDYEHEFTMINNAALANEVYYFRVMYCEDSTTGVCAGTAMAKGSGEAYPSVKTAAAYDLEIAQTPADVDLGTYNLGGSGTLEYVFQAGEEMSFWDKRGTAVGYSATVSAFSMTCSSPADTIPGADITWTASTGDLSVAFASDKAGTTAPDSGSNMGSDLDAYTAGSSGDKTVRTGGFYFLPTLDFVNLNSREICTFSGTLQITIV